MSKTMSEAIESAFKVGVLQKDVHSRLIDDIESIAMDGGIQCEWIARPLAHFVSKEEVTWVRTFKRHRLEGHTGLCLTGADADVEDRMSAIAGALIRNFIRARVLTLGQLLSSTEGRNAEVPNPTCLLVPNFFLGKAYGGQLPAWKIAALHDIVLSRHLAGMQTVLYVSDMKSLANEYGAAMASIIKSHYVTIEL